jgi:hypothetical protein
VGATKAVAAGAGSFTVKIGGAVWVTGVGLTVACLTGTGGVGVGTGGAVLGIGKSMICAKTSTGTMTSTARINKPVCSAQIAKAWNSSTELAMTTLRFAAKKDGLGSVDNIEEDIKKRIVIVLSAEK